MTTAPLSHLRGPQRIAADAALEQIAQRGTKAPDEQTIATWAKALWTRDGVGVIDPGAAIKALEAFCDREPKPQPVVLGQTVLSAKGGGMLLRSAAMDDGADWKDSIDLGNVPARLVALKADVEWVFGLDITKPEQFTALGKWLGNKWGWEEQTQGSSWTRSTEQSTVLGALASRHGLPRSFTETYLEQAFTDDPATRERQTEMFLGMAEPHARKIYEREAKFDAFLDAAPKIRERVQFERLSQDDVRHELEDALGFERDAIHPHMFERVFDQAVRDHGDAHCDPRTLGYVQVFINEQIHGAVTDGRIASTLITTGLANQLDAGTISDADAIKQLEQHFGAPKGSISEGTLSLGRGLVPVYRPQYDR